MNLALYIYSFLKERESSVIVPDFGVFSIEKKPAVLDGKTSKMYPPSENISFERMESISDDKLKSFIVERSGLSTEKVLVEIKNAVENWKSKLRENKKLDLESLGEIQLTTEEAWSFVSKNQNSSIHYFGLEEISLQEIEGNRENATFNKAILWSFLIILPIVAFVYLGIVNKDYLLGKSSFENTHRIKEKPIIKPIPADTLKKDSLRVDTIKVKNK